MFDFTPENILIWIALGVGFFLFYMLFMPQIMGLQSKFAIRRSKKSLEKFEKWAEDSQKIALKEITEHGRTRRDVKEEFDNFREFFTIEPVSADPSGVLDRLEHLLDVRKKRFEGAVKKFAPEADGESAANLEMTIEGAIASYTIFKVMRHLVLLAEKTESYQLATILQMQMPMLEEMAKAYNTATEAFADGKAIGDGIGPLVAAKLIGDSSSEEEIKDTVFVKTEVEGRRTYIIKARGPGGRVGKPGELIKELSKNRKLNRIIMIDAALKLEGEESGQIVEGVGAAIGGPPTEKHKIEELATKRNIPLDALVVKEGFKEAITPLSKKLSKSVDKTVEKVKQIIRERTEEDDAIFIAGIGNTIGVGQSPDQVPTEFPTIEKDEEEIESFQLLFGP
ncbi:MAG: DUF1512 domain-containing protein [Hadesarchaea archaeon]|nr:DUF1512 domain-containing protein [Hadesarchaea archaeon]